METVHRSRSQEMAAKSSPRHHSALLRQSESGEMYTEQRNGVKRLGDPYGIGGQRIGTGGAKCTLLPNHTATHPSALLAPPPLHGPTHQGALAFPNAHIGRLPIHRRPHQAVKHTSTLTRCTRFPAEKTDCLCAMHCMWLSRSAVGSWLAT